MAIFIDKFVLPSVEREEEIIKIASGDGFLDNPYPCNLFPKKGLSELDFEKITIIYGGNGSGKSTLLNLIASCAGVKRFSEYNHSKLFGTYVNSCKIRMAQDDEGYVYKCVPHNSRIITSDDIFDYMLTARESNRNVVNEEKVQEQERNRLLRGQRMQFTGIDNYEEFSKQVDARYSLSKRQFIYKFAGKEVKLNSNGETALEFFDKKLVDGCLYCLDEPENSLSPKFQQELVELIADKARYSDCQFIIATHSPFVLSLDGAKIYDLDSYPVDIKKWWELENVKTYFDFFDKNKHLFMQ